MSWRTVVISRRCKLDLNMGYMVIRGEEIKRIFIDEIAVVVIENPAVSITGCLLNELANKKARVIFCNEKRSPYAELQPYHGSYDCSHKLRTQIKWTDEQKGLIWTAIVAEKIKNQSRLLAELGHEDESRLLSSYIDELLFNDESNREGHAAKVYFNALFGKDFSRGNENHINAALNYGYGIILSAINREVTINGINTQLGLCHDNMFNPYNFSCDLMEPFRVLIDRKVISLKHTKFESEEKRSILSLLNARFLINDTQQTLLNAIKIYVKRHRRRKCR